MNEYKNLYFHYVESVWIRRRLIALVVFATAAATCLLSLVLLFASPVYKATTIVTMLPSNSELQYTQGWLGRSQIDPTTIGTTTHLEYLYSRPVQETALDYILESYGSIEPPPSSGLRARLRESMRSVKSKLWEIYETINYGAFKPISDRELQLNNLRAGLTIEPMQASYILRIEAAFDSPKLAALAANALAEAYVNFAADQSRATTAALEAFLNSQIADRRANHDRLGIEAGKITAKIADAPSAAALLRGLEAERVESDERARLLAAVEAEIEALASDEADRRALLEARRDALSLQVAKARHDLRTSQEQMNAFQEERDSLAEIELRMSSLGEDLSDLRERLLTVNLATTEAISRVRVVEPARPPLQPDSPKVFNYTVASAFAALFLSGIAVIILDVFNDSVVTRAQLSRLGGQPTLGVLPLRLGARKPKAAARNPALLRAVDRLRDKLARIGGDGPPVVHAVGFGPAGSLATAARLLRLGLESHGANARPTSEAASGSRPAEVLVVEHRAMNPAALQEAGRRGEIVLGLVARGAVREAEIARFVRDAGESGVEPEWILLTGSA